MEDQFPVSHQCGDHPKLQRLEGSAALPEFGTAGKGHPESGALTEPPEAPCAATRRGGVLRCSALPPSSPPRPSTHQRQDLRLLL